MVINMEIAHLGSKDYIYNSSNKKCIHNKFIQLRKLEEIYQKSKSYTEIKNAFVDDKGKTRLFVTHGRNEGLTPQKLIGLIKDICNIPDRDIRDIQILEKFSFVTLPFHEAEILLARFSEKQQRSGLFITKAKTDRDKGKSSNFKPRNRR